MNNDELRDYFAGQALSGLLANQHLQKEFLKDTKKVLKEMLGLEEGDENLTVSKYMQYHHALISYAFADAMLKQKYENIKNYDKEKNTRGKE